MLVGKIMTRDPITISPDTSHREAFELIKQHKISQLPVLDHGRLVGVVSEADLLSTQPSPATSLSIHEIYSLLEKLSVRQFMTHPVYTVAEDCPVEVAAQIMIDHNLGCLPIMRGEELVGIVSVTDLFKVLVKVLGGGQEGLRFTVGVENVPGKLAEIARAVTESGGDIISVVTWSHDDTQEAKLTIKERGANQDQLRAKLAAAGAELVEMSEGGDFSSQIFGKRK